MKRERQGVLSWLFEGASAVFTSKTDPDAELDKAIKDRLSSAFKRARGHRFFANYSLDLQIEKVNDEFFWNDQERYRFPSTTEIGFRGLKEAPNELVKLPRNRRRAYAQNVMKQLTQFHSGGIDWRGQRRKLVKNIGKTKVENMILADYDRQYKMMRG